MTKPSVYIETTVIGHLAARLQPDPVVAGRQLVTREWWNTAPDRFRLVVSQLVAQECAAGDIDAAAERFALLKPLEFVQWTVAAQLLAAELHSSLAIPSSEPRDALHVSIAATNGIEYLVTWNFAHIANAITRGVIEETCREFGCEPPKICTPDELLGAWNDR